MIITLNIKLRQVDLINRNFETTLISFLYDLKSTHAPPFRLVSCMMIHLKGSSLLNLNHFPESYVPNSAYF